MYFTARRRYVAIVIALCAVAEAAAQQTAPQQPGVQPQGVQQQPAAQAPVQPPAAAPMPPGFQLNALEQANLDQVLDKWQLESGTVITFKCPFERWEYDIAFGPNNNQDPLNKNKGELSYHKPDKGSFEITEINTFKELPVPPGTPRKGDWVKQPDAIGDHWVCDGKSVYEYRPSQKQLVEHPIPPQLQGQAIVDGPLPFLFGADAAKLKQRYWMRIDQTQNQDPNQIWLIARPKFQEQAADLTEVDVILDRQRLLPKYMQVWMPNKSRHMYIFDIDKSSKNNPIDRIQALFERPRIPFGWKRVVENLPLQQAAAPMPANLPIQQAAQPQPMQK
jgi:TIGR03009 family protein